MTVSVWQDRSGDKRFDCDVAVVGAGVVGAYLALALRRTGLRVVVLEARFPAAGATGRNAGMVLTGLSDYYHTAVRRYGRETARTVWEMTVENGRRTRQLHEDMGLQYEACGSLLLAVDDTEAAELLTAHEAMRRDGLPGVFHSIDPLGRGFAGALEQPQDIGIDPVAFTETMLRESGARLLENCEVYHLEAAGDGVRLRSRLATVLAEHVMLATNAYSPLLHPSFQGVVAPTRAQVLLTAPSPPVLDTLCYANYGHEYFRQVPDGRLLLGGWRDRFVDDERGYADEVTPGVQQGLECFLRERFPEADGEVMMRWSGVMGFSPDGLPLVGRLPDLPAVGYAVGFTGHGLGLGLTAADALIDLILLGRYDGPFSASRLESAVPA